MANSTTTKTYSLSMFLMWTSSATGSIPVPIRYQTWGFSGTASQVAGGAWTVTTNGTPGPVGGFIPSSPSQNTQTQPTMQLGYPTWTTLSSQTCP